MTLEERCARLEEEVLRLKEDVRLKRVAESFPASPIGPGDYFTSDGNVGKLCAVMDDGKWRQLMNGRLFEGNPAWEPSRLYTEAEVRAILAERRP